MRFCRSQSEVLRAPARSPRVSALICALALALPLGCGRAVNIEVHLRLPKDDIIRSQADTLVLTAKQENADKPAVLQTQFAVKGTSFETRQFTAEKNTTMVIEARAFTPGRASTLGYGRATFKVSDGPTQKVSFYFGPTDHFANHPEPSSRYRRRDAATFVAQDGSIWIVGGKDMESSEYLAAVEVYNPKTLEFRTMPPMEEGRSFAAVTSFKIGDSEIVVVAGGTGAQGSSKLIEAYDPKIGKKSAAAALFKGRTAAAIMPLPGSRVAVLGGAGDADASTNVEVLTIDTQSLSITHDSRFSTDGHTLVLDRPRVGGMIFTDPSNNYFLAGGLDQPAIQRIDTQTAEQPVVSAFATPRHQYPLMAASKEAIYIAAGGEAEVEMWPFGSNSPPMILGRDIKRRVDAAGVVLPSGGLLVTGGDVTDSNTGVSAPTEANLLFDLSEKDVQPNSAGRTSINFQVPRSGHRLIMTDAGTIIAIGGSATGAPIEILSIDPSVAN